MILLLRVDHRLLHGQVVFSWIQNLKVDDNFSQTIKLAELSRLANMSATKPKKLFRQFTGCTITKYI